MKIRTLDKNKGSVRLSKEVNSIVEKPSNQKPPIFQRKILSVSLQPTTGIGTPELMIDVDPSPFI